MESFNFGAFDPTIGARLAAIPQEAQKQQTANMLQAMQMQGAMREGQMSQMKIDEMLAERKEIDAFAANLKARGYTQGSKGFFTELASSRNLDRMRQGFEGLRRLEEQDKFAAIMGRTRPAAAPVAPEPGSSFASRTNMLPGAAAAPAGVNALAGNAAEIEFKRQQRNDLIGMGTTQSIAAARAIDADIALLARKPSYQNVPGVGLVNTDDKSVVMPSVEKPAAPPSMVAEYTFAKTPDGGNFRGTFQDFVTARAAAVRPLAQPRPDRLLTPDEEAQKIRIAQGSRPPPVETRPLTAQQQLKARETQVAQRGVVKSADTAATELETLADNLLGNPGKKIQPNPGLGGITGYMGLIPSLPNTAARSAQQQLDTFKGKVMAFGRLLATQQGKLGNMAVSEWKFISDAIEKIDPLANNFDTQLRDVVRQAKDFAAAKRETFDELYDSTTPTGGANAPQAPVDLQSAARAEIARRAKDKR